MKVFLQQIIAPFQCETSDDLSSCHPDALQVHLAGVKKRQGLLTPLSNTPQDNVSRNQSGQSLQRPRP